MNREFLAPFVASLGDTFSTMLSCAIRPGAPPILPSPIYYAVTGIIGLSGGADGVAVVSLSRETALKAASALLLTETTEINADVIDAVGEITNMVAGAAKAKLEQFQLRIGLPSVVTGSGHEVNLPSNIAPLCLAFESDWGPLTLTVGMVTVEHAVPA